MSIKEVEGKHKIRCYQMPLLKEVGESPVKKCKFKNYDEYNRQDALEKFLNLNTLEIGLEMIRILRILKKI